MNTKPLTFVFFLFAQLHYGYGQPGSLDGDFDANGKVIIDFGNGYDVANDLAIQSDNKILLAGASHNGADSDFALVRLNVDGSLDASFDGDGKVSLDYNSVPNSFTSISVLSNGQIMVLGQTNYSPSIDVVLARYNANGSIDNSFGTNGLTIIDFNGMNDRANDMSILPDGKILIVGETFNGVDSDFMLIKCLADGTLDNSFSVDGKLSADFAGGEDVGNSIIALPDGKILAAGSSKVPSRDFSMAQFNADGTLDLSFGVNGKVTTDMAGSSDFQGDLAVDSSGNIFLSGQAFSVADNDVAVAKYNPDGSLFTSFGVNGKVTIPVGDENDGTSAITLQQDGKILLGGYSNQEAGDTCLLMRLNADGSPDASFGNNGAVFTGFGGENNYGKSLAIQADGRILMSGSTSNGSDYSFTVARYLSGLNIGVADFTESSSQVLVYPNPVSERLTFEYSLKEKEIVSLEIFDITGKSVQTVFSKQQRLSGDHRETMSVAHLSSGTYIFRLSTHKGSVNVQFVR